MIVEFEVTRLKFDLLNSIRKEIPQNFLQDDS